MLVNRTERIHCPGVARNSRQGDPANNTALSSTCGTDNGKQPCHRMTPQMTFPRRFRSIPAEDALETKTSQRRPPGHRLRDRAFISPTSSVATSAQFIASCTSANQLRTLRLEATLGVTLSTEMPCVSALGFTDNGWPRASCPFALLPPAQACPNPRPAFGPFPASQKIFRQICFFAKLLFPSHGHRLS